MNDGKSQSEITLPEVLDALRTAAPDLVKDLGVLAPTLPGAASAEAIWTSWSSSTTHQQCSNLSGWNVSLVLFSE